MPELTESGGYKGILKRAVLMPLVVMIVLAVVLLLQVRYLMTVARLVDRSDRSMSVANQILRLAVDGETGERGYLLGGDRKFLQPYIEAQKSIQEPFDHLLRLVQDDPAAIAQVRSMRETYARWTALASAEIASRDHDPGYRRVFNRGAGKQVMDHLREQSAHYIDETTMVREKRFADSRQLTTLAFVVTGALTIIVGLILAFFTRRQMQDLTQSYALAMRAIQEREQWLSITLASIGDGVLATNSEGRISFINPVAENLTGWTNAEAKQKPADDVFNIINESSRQKVDSPLTRVLSEGIVVGLANHTLLIAKNGLETPIDDSGAPIRDSAGNMIGTVLVFRDISERKEREHAEAAANRRISDVLASTSDGVLTLDNDWKITDINMQAERLLALSPEALTKRIWETLQLSDESRWRQEFERALSTHTSVDFEEFYTPRDIWLEVRAFPLADRGLSVFVQDITLRKRDESEREKQLSKAEAERSALSAVLNQMPAAMVIVDGTTGRMLVANEGIERIFQESFTEDAHHADFANWNLYQLDGAPLTPDQHPIRRVMSDDVSTHEAELQLERLDGSRIIVLVNAGPVKDGDGNTIVAVCGLLDITERKQSEREIRALNRRLQRAMEETHHRVRNNLQIIAAMVDMQKMEHEDTVPTSELSRLSAHVRTLGAIHDLLTERAKLDGQAQEISVKELLDKLLPMLEMTAPGSRFSCSVQDAVLSTRRATSLALITNELVTNAIKYGKLEIDVHFTVAGSEATLEIWDDGAGLPEQFDPVRSAHTGLGLVEHLAHWDLSGLTAYDNAPAGGARVRVVFPIISTPEHQVIL